jgi:hypothetical protein
MSTSLRLLLICGIVSIMSATALADVKVKSRQTVSGQSYENTTYIKGKRQRTESMGGMVNITQCDLKRGIQLNQGSKTYMVTPFATTTQTTTSAPASATVDKNGVVQTGGRVTTTITTKDTGERKQMFGYTARRLIITIETVSSADACNKTDSKMQTDGWYIDAAFALDCDMGMGSYGANYGTKGGCRDTYNVKTVGTAKRGFPVYEKTTMFDGAGNESFTMVNEVIEFSQAALDATLFEVPQGFREVSDPSQMYSAGSFATGGGDDESPTPVPTTSKLAAQIGNSAKTGQQATSVGPKKAGVIRIGVPTVKTGSVGEGIAAADLAAAVRNTLVQQIRNEKVEVVLINANPQAAIDAEAHAKECDLVVYLTASHKKGGGGFGMFKSLAPVISSIAPAAGSAAGSGGYLAGSLAADAVTASVFSSQLKSKDEVTVDVRLNRTGSASVYEQSFKAKARSNGEDIISQLIAQAAKGIGDAVAKL